MYSADDFDARPEFTEPEILRTNLASVILQMSALGLGDVAAFPFLEPPDSAAIRDGYLLLDELGAIEPDQHDKRIGDHDDEGDVGQTAGRRLTKIGSQLARLPVDPRLGRMVLEADHHGCVREVLVIASALSIQDPRERPKEHQQQADESHRRFDVDGSDLLSLVELWDYLRDQQKALSGNQFRRMCKSEYLNYLRVREWRDLYSQLRQVAGQLGVRPGTDASHRDHVHQALLSGLLSHVGMRDGEAREFRGARGARFVIANGSVVSRRPPRWVMAAELVETNRLWARRVATIQPEWAEKLAPHLVKRSYGEPWWDAERGRASAIETVMLYGLPIVAGRPVGYDRVDPDVARGMFIRYAMVEGAWQTHHAFVTRNQTFRERLRKLEARVRRGDLLDDDTLFRFFDERLDLDVTTPRHFDRWWKREIERQPALFDLTDDILATAHPGHPGIDLSEYPDTWVHGDLSLPLTYRFDPGGPLDGVTAHVPLTALNMISDEGFDWQIPGYRFELVAALVRSLPKHLRRELIPASETTNAAFDLLGEPSGRLVDRLASALSQVADAPIRATDFNLADIPPELRMNFVVADAEGNVHDAGADLGEIAQRLASATRSAIAAAAPVSERRGITTWDLGDLTRSVDTAETGHTVRGFPTLLDQGDSVSLRIVTNEALQQRAMRGGVKRLLLLSAAPSAKVAGRDIDRRSRLSFVAADVSLDDLLDDSINAAVERVLDDHELPWDEQSFVTIQLDVRERAGDIAADAAAAAVFILAAAERVQMRADRMIAESLRPTVHDAVAHVRRLTASGFVSGAGTRRLPDIHRYVRGVEFRLEKLNGDIARDHRRMADVVPLEQRLAAHVRHLDRAAPEETTALAWQLEELRMSVFAQPMGVHGTVSPKRIRRQLDALGA